MNIKNKSNPQEVGSRPIDRKNEAILMRDGVNVEKLPFMIINNSKVVHKGGYVAHGRIAGEYTLRN